MSSFDAQNDKKLNLTSRLKRLVYDMHKKSNLNVLFYCCCVTIDHGFALFLTGIYRVTLVKNDDHTKAAE
jgi:hypothetical protein